MTKINKQKIAWHTLATAALVDKDYYYVLPDACEVIIIDGHGFDPSDPQQHEFDFKPDRDKNCIDSYVGFVGCHARSNNEQIPASRRVQNNSHQISEGSFDGESPLHHAQQRNMLIDALLKARQLCDCNCPMVTLIVLDVESSKKPEGSITFLYDCAPKRVTHTTRTGTAKKGERLRNYYLDSRGRNAIDRPGVRVGTSPSRFGRH